LRLGWALDSLVLACFVRAMFLTVCYVWLLLNAEFGLLEILLLSAGLLLIVLFLEGPLGLALELQL
jgi:hypothetical protein